MRAISNVHAGSIWPAGCRYPTQWRAEGGERGAGPGHPRPGGHPKSEITKNEML